MIIRKYTDKKRKKYLHSDGWFAEVDLKSLRELVKKLLDFVMTG